MALDGCRCALCHKEQEANEFGEVSLQRGLGLTPDAATNRGLGPLLLVKVSAIANAWVHSQCAVWSPEVPSPPPRPWLTGSHLTESVTVLVVCRIW